MPESTTTDLPTEHPGPIGSAPRRRRPLLFASLGVILAGALAAILLTATGNASGPASSGPSGPSLAGVSDPTAALLSVSAFPGSGRVAPDFHLTDQNGNPVSLSQFRGQSVVLSFNDDQCTDVCTLLAEDVVRADQDMTATSRSRVAFLSVNVNPFFPQVSAVRQWSDQNDLGGVSNWYFGTGSVPTLQSIWKEYGVYVGTDAASQSVTHSTLIEFIDPAGRIRATADFGQNAVDVDPYSHGLAQVAVDYLPTSDRGPVTGPQAPAGGGTGGGLGQTAPTFSLPTVSLTTGRTTASALSLRDLRGKPVVLNFWASTCQDCRSELAAFAAAAKAIPKATFIGVDVADPSTGNAAALARSAGVGYPIVDDHGGQVAAQYRVAGLPTTVYVDPNGQVSVVHPGAMTEEQLKYTLGQFFPGVVPADS